MRRLTIAAAILGCSTIPAGAQISPNGTQGAVQGTTQARPTQRHSRPPVATQPSNSPFQNPIGQGAPPAVSANPNNNSRMTR